VTVFVYGEPVWPHEHNDCYVDEVVVEIITPEVPEEEWLPSTDPAIIAAIEAGDLPEMQTKVRWCVEEALRVLKGCDAAYAIRILDDLVEVDGGLMYQAERAASES